MEYELFRRIPFTIQSYTFAVLWKKLFMLLGLNLWLKKKIQHQKSISNIILCFLTKVYES